MAETETAALAAEATGPLKGVRILDMTGVVFGAYATQMLGDLGADVIKVEFPGGRRGGGGDIMRWAGSPPEGAPADLGPIFMTINRNKRSALLDLREPGDMDALRRLIPTCQVFAVTVRMDGLERLGLGYDGVKALRPDVIYCHGSGYGAGGAYAGEPAYDDLIQAASGLGDLLNRADGDPTPRYLPSLVADKTCGLFMSQAILAALFHHARTGKGQFVEVPMMECVTSFNLAEHFFGHVYQPPTGQWAYSRVATAHRKPFPTADGHIGMLPYTVQQWDDFFAIAGWTQTIARDPRFASAEARHANAHELYARIDEVTVTKTTAEWLALLRPLAIPVIPLNRLDDLPGDARLQSVGFFERHEHPQAGPYTAMRPPVRYSGTPANIRRHAPGLGEHTQEIVAEADALLGKET